MIKLPRIVGVTLGVIVTASLVVTTTPATADEVVAQLARDTPISAYGGFVAWSDHDAVADRYRLMLRRGDSTTPAAITPARQPFDVSLGPDARGRVVALYTRCRTTTRGCDVYRYDVAARRERRVAAASSPRHDEAWPVQWRDRLAFVRRARVYGIQAPRSNGLLIPDPRGRRGGGELVDCDVPYVKTLSSRAPARRLDRGLCARTIGMSIRGPRIVQVTSFYLDFNAAESQVRRLSAGGGRMRVLARSGSGLDGYSQFTSPSQSAGSVWLTRIGNRDPQDFLRVGVGGGKLTAVQPNLLLAGRVARDERGRFWYVQGPEPLGDTEAAHGFPPFCGSGIGACHLVRASASPFSSRERTLPVALRMTSDYVGVVYGDTAEVAGNLTRPVVRRSAVLRREPLPGAAIELLRVEGPEEEPRVVPTGVTTTTDGDGHWSFAMRQGPPNATFAAVAPALGWASGPTKVSTLARVTLSSTGARTLAGTVTPAQPGAVVALQRLRTDAAGNPPDGCDPGGSGPRACTEDKWTTVLEAQLAAGGTSYATSVTRPGFYRADLQHPGRPTGPLYYGRSPVVSIG